MRRFVFLPVASLAWAAACSQGTGQSPPSPAVTPPVSAAPTPEVTPVAPSASVSASASASASAPPVAMPSPQGPEPLPAGFVKVEESDATMCDGLKVEVLKEPGLSFERFVRVSGPGGSRVYEAHGRKYKLDKETLQMDLWGEFCGDLTGDGVPELVMTERTIGAHCCYTHYVVSLTTPSKRLLMWEKGDAGTEIVPVKYGKGKAWQVEGSVVFWPPFDTEAGDPVLSYAGAPMLPVVFSLVGDEYRKMTLSFPEVFQKRREETLASCKQTPICFGDISLWLDSLALGDWNARKVELVPEVELRERLDIRAAQTFARMKSAIGGVPPGPGKK